MIKNDDTKKFRQALKDPGDNFTFIIGGTDMPEKFQILSHVIEKARTILIGGEIAYTFLKSKGVDTGNTKVHEDYLSKCSNLLKKAEEKGIKIVLPVDHIAAIKAESNITIRMVRSGEEIPEEMKGFDIGYDSIKLFMEEIDKSELIIWNGALGIHEIDTFSAGTIELLKSTAKSSAPSFIIGESLYSKIEDMALSSKLTHLYKGDEEINDILKGK
jgi:3-phosphoglycerate kinase